MKRQVPGLAETVRDSRPEIPDGIFLVRVDGAQFRWHAHKPFYVLRPTRRSCSCRSPGTTGYCQVRRNRNSYAKLHENRLDENPSQATPSEARSQSLSPAPLRGPGAR
jgi:hypothetical protein